MRGKKSAVASGLKKKIKNRNQLCLKLKNALIEPRNQRRIPKGDYF